MTTEQKNRIVALREAGYGYTAVARELGLNKNTVCSYCHKIGLAGVRKKPEINLICSPNRGNTEHAESLENKRLKRSEMPLQVVRVFAEKPDETAEADILKMLIGAR